MLLSSPNEKLAAPKPDVGFQTEDGVAADLKFDVSFEGQHDFREQLETERREVEKPLSRSGRVGGNSLLAGVFVTQPTKDDWDAYKQKLEKYLEGYEVYLKYVAKWEDIARRARTIVLSFSNTRAGVPAEGVRAVLRFPDSSEGLLVVTPDDIPQRPKKPTRPKVPQPQRVGDFSGLMRPPVLPTMPSVDPHISNLGPSNVSGPRLSEGLQLLEYEIGELLHNFTETTKGDPAVLIFTNDVWTVPYEVHARNLLKPKQGTLRITVRSSGRGHSGNPA